jgi:ribosomal protein S18 acetylase RimI-like enzyme
MNQEFIIERVNKQNFNDLLYLIEKLAEYEKLEPPDKKAKNRLMKEGIGKNSKYRAFLGKLNGNPISYVIYYMTYSSFLALPTLFLEDIFVLENYRRNSVGQRMFDFCVEKAKEKGCGRIEWCVLNWNTPAIKFYEKNKATKMDWTFFRFTKDQIDSYIPKKN